MGTSGLPSDSLEDRRPGPTLRGRGSCGAWRDAIETLERFLATARRSIERDAGLNDAGRIAASSHSDGRQVAVRLTPVDRPAADITGDCRVDDNDLLVLLFEWGAGPSVADLDGDGAVGVTDLLLFLSWWTGGP